MFRSYFEHDKNDFQNYHIDVYWFSILGLQLQEQFNSASGQEENEIKREENV